MGQSLYYTATRSVALSEAETAAIDALVDEFDVSDRIESFVQGGDGLNWESFVWRAGAGDAVFVGSVRLPDVTMGAIFDGIAHWGRLVGRIRNEVLGDGVWDVNVDGDQVPWLADEGRFWDRSWDGLDLDGLEDLI